LTLPVASVAEAGGGMVTGLRSPKISHWGWGREEHFNPSGFRIICE
jgi:hypothetical protein